MSQWPVPSATPWRWGSVAPASAASVPGVVPLAPGYAPPPKWYPPLQGPAWQIFKERKPKLALDIVACTECVADPVRFQNDGEEVFASLRKNIMKCPREELEEILGKAQVWDFLTRFVATRSFYRSQAAEVSKKLESDPSWSLALYREPDLVRRKNEWLG